MNEDYMSGWNEALSRAIALAKLETEPGKNSDDVRHKVYKVISILSALKMSEGDQE